MFSFNFIYPKFSGYKEMIKYFSFEKKPEIDFSNLKPIDLSKINMIDFPDNQYFKSKYHKNQIILHHTVSGPSARGDISTWLSTESRIATCMIIDGEGVPNQLFSSKYYGAHLGCRQFYLKTLGFCDYKIRNKKLDRESIAVELDNWGWLKKEDNIFRTYYGNKVNVDITTYKNKWRGHKYFQAYNIGQLRSLGELLLYWNKRYKIPLDYHEDMWDVSKRALEGHPGIWTHASFRPACDKTDCHPDPNLINLLKTLSTLI